MSTVAKVLEQVAAILNIMKESVVAAGAIYLLIGTLLAYIIFKFFVSHQQTEKWNSKWDQILTKSVECITTNNEILRNVLLRLKK